MIPAIIIAVGVLVLRWTFRKYFTFYGPDDNWPGDKPRKKRQPKQA